MTGNPFIFGRIVRGEHFCNREKEMDNLKERISAKQHVVIISPRRYGKTSLIINALERNKTKYIYIDCSFIGTEKSLINNIANSYAEKADSVAVIEKLLKKFDLVFSINVNPIGVNISEIRSETLKDLITQISKDYVIIFDEFQDIYEKDKQLVSKLRSIVQFLERSVVMLGSKRHLLHHMFLNPRGIFYNFGYALALEKIGATEFEGFISGWFKKSGSSINKAELEKILSISQCHPFFTQYLCHFFFENRVLQKNSKSTVEEVVSDIVAMNLPFYEETYRDLAEGQKKALLLLSRENKEVYSSELLEKFDISSQGLQKALGALMKREIIDKNGSYYIIDVFFKEWLYQMGLNQKV
ncbi:ATP-binding protein [Candidatus Micrarchaeota archaeon]|nr:ATP-binding protein [Candidatus Micrarchaeota archaeon]